MTAHVANWRAGRSRDWTRQEIDCLRVRQFWTHICLKGRNSIPVSYPIVGPLHFPSGVQYPKTPNLTPRYVAMGIALITGVEIVESSSRQKATKNSIDKGVAGRSMLAEKI